MFVKFVMFSRAISCQTKVLRIFSSFDYIFGTQSYLKWKIKKLKTSPLPTEAELQIAFKYDSIIIYSGKTMKKKKDRPKFKINWIKRLIHLNVWRPAIPSLPVDGCLFNCWSADYGRMTPPGVRARSSALCEGEGRLVAYVDTLPYWCTAWNNYATMELISRRTSSPGKFTIRVYFVILPQICKCC